MVTLVTVTMLVVSTGCDMDVSEADGDSVDPGIGLVPIGSIVFQSLVVEFQPAGGLVNGKWLVVVLSGAPFS